MTDRKTRTLAYTKSPKASRRTTFQDELETAVSARSSKKTTALDSDEDDNDFLKDLLKSRKKRIDAIAAMKNMAKMNNFELSDDEGENSRPKRVSFLKTQRVVTSSEDIMASDSHKDEQHLPEPSNSNQNDSSDSQLSQKEHSKSAASDVSAMDPTHSQSPSESLEGSEQRRDSVHEEGSKANSPQPLEMETSSAHISETDGIVERELPTPKPRTRTHALRSQGIVDQTEEDTASPQSRAMTSSVSIPLSSDTASNSASSPRRATSRSSSLPVPERDQADSITSSQARTDRSRSLPISTVDSGTKDYHTSDDSKAHDGKYSTSFEEFHENSEEHLDHSISRLSHGPENSSDTRASSLPTKCPRRSQSACSSKVRSKYMGTLKVLDRKVPVEGSQPEADSLRAAIYQEWLQKKKEKLRENMQLKTQEDKLKEENTKKKEQDKREHAIASYNAWKEKKSETLKAKAKEKLAATIKEQRATEEKEEKKEAAKKMFEKWKQEHDELLKEKYRQQKGAESKCKQKKQHTEEERKKDSNSAFSTWNEKKKNVVMKKMTEERKEHKNKAEEETYLKEEKDKMALEMYEKWLIKKERDQRRQREERKIQAILDDEPPPPWSPPNKTIPFRK